VFFFKDAGYKIQDFISILKKRYGEEKLDSVQEVNWCPE
jgi:hypothetical protein